MAKTKVQEDARQRRIDKAAEAIYMIQAPRHPHQAALMFKSWKELKRVEKDLYREMAEKAVRAYES